MKSFAQPEGQYNKSISWILYNVYDERKATGRTTLTEARIAHGFHLH